VSFNAIGISPVGLQGIPLGELPVESFLRPITTYAQAHFITAKSAAWHMIARRSGVIMMHTPEPARAARPGTSSVQASLIKFPSTRRSSWFPGLHQSRGQLRVCRPDVGCA
jgi:hypothetical protein